MWSVKNEWTPQIPVAWAVELVNFQKFNISHWKSQTKIIAFQASFDSWNSQTRRSGHLHPYIFCDTVRLRDTEQNLHDLHCLVSNREGLGTSL